MTGPDHQSTKGNQFAKSCKINPDGVTGTSLLYVISHANGNENGRFLVEMLARPKK
jgi:hypothetical protein